MSTRIDFTPEQIAAGQAMRRNGKSWGDVGEVFGVSSATARKCVTGVHRVPRTMPRGMRRAQLNLGEANRVTAPAKALAEREHRMGLTRSLTAEFFGDPLPGYSALDRNTQKMGASCDIQKVDAGELRGTFISEAS